MTLLTALGLPPLRRQGGVARPAPIAVAAPAAAGKRESGSEGERPRGAQSAREKTTGQGEFIGDKGVLVFDYAPGQATLSPNQERVLMSQQVKFSSRGARIRIIGHSSSEEDAAVSGQRADVVAEFLRSAKKHPVPDANILEATGMGAKRPLAPEQVKGKVDEKNRKRNRSVEVVLISAENYLGGEVEVDVKGVGKDAPKVHESDALGYTDIVAHIIAGVFEGSALGFAAEFVAPFVMMLDVALSWEEARAGQQRIAFADGMTKSADAARDFIAHHHASVEYKDVEAAAMPRIDDMTYFPADKGEASYAASTGINAGVSAFNPAMRKTEEFVSAKLAAKNLAGPKLKAVYDKIIDDMRARVAHTLADAVKAEAKKVRRG